MGKSKLSGKEMRAVGDVLEDYLKRRFKLRKTSGSGNAHEDGDLIGSLFHFESKATEDRSFTIKADVWEKIQREATAFGKYPLYITGQVDTRNDSVKQVLVVSDIDYLYNLLKPDTLTAENIERKLLAEIGQVLSTLPTVSSSMIKQIEDTIRRVCQESNTL